MTEITFGTYASINDLPRFAALVAEKGPFNPQVYVVIKRNLQGQYTIDEEVSYTEDESGVRTQLIEWDFEMYEEDGGVLGLSTALPGIAQTEFGGARYNIWANDTVVSDHELVYSVTFDIPNAGGQMHMLALAIPSDHPVLQCYRRINQPV
jgi:hypothetical protein